MTRRLNRNHCELDSSGDRSSFVSRMTTEATPSLLYLVSIKKGTEYIPSAL